MTLKRCVNSAVAFMDFEPKRSSRHGKQGVLESMASLLDRVNETVVRGKWDCLSVETIKVNQPDSSVYDIDRAGHYNMQAIRVWYRVAPFHEGLVASTMLPRNYSAFGLKLDGGSGGSSGGAASPTPRFKERRASVTINV